jgi:hypothetical protein
MKTRFQWHFGYKIIWEMVTFCWGGFRVLPWCLCRCRYSIHCHIGNMKIDNSSPQVDQVWKYIWSDVCPRVFSFLYNAQQSHFRRHSLQRKSRSCWDEESRAAVSKARYVYTSYTVAHAFILWAFLEFLSYCICKFMKNAYCLHLRIYSPGNPTCF